MKKHIVMGVSLLLICSTTTHPLLSKVSDWWSKAKEETVSYSYNLEPNATITVANLKGDVNIKSWKQDKLVVEAVKKGSETAIENTTVEARCSDSKAIIKTLAENKKSECNVTYNIIVPENAHLQAITTKEGSITVRNTKKPLYASTDKGNITCEQISNSIHVKSKKGNIAIDSKGLESHHQVIAMTARGNVKLALPENNAAYVDATTHKGQVTSDHIIQMQPRAMKVNNTTLAHLKKDIHGSIGTGDGAKVKVHSSSGNIKLVVA